LSGGADETATGRSDREVTPETRPETWNGSAAWPQASQLVHNPKRQGPTARSTVEGGDGTRKGEVGVDQGKTRGRQKFRRGVEQAWSHQSRRATAFTWGAKPWSRQPSEWRGLHRRFDGGTTRGQWPAKAGTASSEGQTPEERKPEHGSGMK